MNYKKLIQTLLTMTVVFYGTMVIGNYATCRDLDMDLPPIQDVLHQNNFIIPETPWSLSALILYPIIASPVV